MKIEDFEITPEQEKAFKKIVNAIKEANKKGLNIYAKSGDLCAYQKKAMAHAAPQHETWNHGETIPYISATVLADSGADDMECFPKGFITE